MNATPFPASSTWFSALVALLVALGAQVLLESVVPASVALGSFGWPEHPGATRLVAGESLWVSDTVIRFLSFTTGGLVAVLLARGLPRSLIALLLVVTVLATVFAQFPSRASMWWVVLWSLAAPGGAVLGAWWANAKRGAA